jgi:oligo-alginate lyase
VLTLLAAAGAALGAEAWTAPEVHLAAGPRGHPVVACRPEELARLKAAWQGTGPAHETVAEVVTKADRFLDEPVTYPPRGGQHNQWYQCETCQLGLKTLSDTQHQCPKCRRIYTGEPYDDVVFKSHHERNLGRMHQAAWAYAITGREKYAEYAAKVLLGYADHYLKYPYHTNNAAKKGAQGPSGGHIDEQTLSEAHRFTQVIAPAYDLVHDSPTLSDDARKVIDRQLIVPMLENIDKYKAGASNWQTWHNAAMLWGGAVLGDESWVRKAIAAPGQGFAFQMSQCLSEEGMWHENSWGYHFYTLHALVETAEGARRLGIDLWSHPNLKKMFLLPIRYAMPDGSLPRFGDAVNASVRSVGSQGEAAYMVYRDPLLVPYLPRELSLQSIMWGRQPGRTSSQPAMVAGSEVMRSAGHAILRAPGPVPLAAAFTFGPYGGFHGHLDKLSFVLFGCGRELGVDPGRAASQAYRLPVHKDWYKATISHNTVIVDRESQKPVAGKLRCFASNDRYSAVSADCTAAYEGVRHQRWLVMTPAYLLVVDTLDSPDKERRFDWLYHNRGDQTRCDIVAEKTDLSAEASGYRYIQNARHGATDDTIRVAFTDGTVTTHLTMAGEPQTQVLIGDGPGESVLDRVPLCMMTRNGRQARFATVLEPVSGSTQPSVSAIQWRRENGAVTVEVKSKESVDTVTLGGDDSVRITVAGRLVLSGRP